MGAWAYIMDLVGEPDGRWPKYCGHLNYCDRMQVVVFLFANGVSPELIKELAGYTQICLRDASAEKHWASLAQACANDKAFRTKYYARDLISSDGVHLDGRVKYNAPSCTVVTPNENILTGVRIVVMTDSLTSIDALASGTAHAPLMQWLHTRLLADENFMRLAPLALIGHGYSDTNVMSGA